MTDQVIFGLIAGAISLAAFVPYIITSVRGKTRPNRATWFIWSVLGLILLASYYAVGARDTIWLMVGNQIGFFATLAVSMRYGEGGWTKLDKGCIVGAGLGLVAWLVFNSPLMALIMSIIMDFIGGIPTIRKAYHDPGSENRMTWFLFSAGNVFNLIAIGNDWTIPIAGYPVYMFLISSLILGILILRQDQLKDIKNRTSD
jgi:hypothetical protein